MNPGSRFEKLWVGCSQHVDLIDKQEGRGLPGLSPCLGWGYCPLMAEKLICSHHSLQCLSFCIYRVLPQS